MIRIALTVKGKILLTVLTVVLMFALFILLYFPARQERYLLENYNEEIENFAKTVALGVKIALTEQNFEGVETAIDFVRHDERLVFVSLVQTDTIATSISDSAGYHVEKTVFKSFPDSIKVDPYAKSSDEYIIKNAPFFTPMMSGEILLSFSTEEIIESRRQIRTTSIIASLIVFIVGLSIGFWLARNISRPVLALRDAANKVGEGDLTQSVKKHSRDEIGELSVAFNKMVKDLSIEAALERVRKKTTAMEQSADLAYATATIFDELERIGWSYDYCGIGIIDAHDQQLNFWTANNPGENNSPWIWSEVSLTGHPLLEGIFHAWQAQESFAYLLKGEDLKSFYQEIITKGFQFPELVLHDAMSQEAQYSFHEVFPAGILSVFRKDPFEDNSVQIMHRFAEAFNLAFTRFQDLQNSEARALEEMKQSTLDRVRGEIAGMRNKEDLTRITPLIWRELTALGVMFIRCGVFIVDEVQGVIHAYLSTPDGNSLGVFDLSYRSNDLAKKLIDYWRKESIYYEKWTKNQFITFMKSLLDQGQIQSESKFQGHTDPPEVLHLNFSPFKQGMLYVGNTSPLTREELNLVQSLAEAFSIAYTRYEDFKQLEEAKNKTEEALSELKATQSQLIHAEKMASLGELTAGIAHEIQNPLNFVNNFSEVSIELFNDMMVEMNSGNGQEVKAISRDIKQNLDKINHHGKRASSIVKGMLEHSRTGKRQKEPTDINAMVDEYLRLAFHGLRAKDKTFNAEYKIDLDKNLPLINVISLDIGRVLLNLINNAFYAVSKKAKNNINGYVPTVIVSTRKLKKQAEIKVTDNADGIPSDVLDKIFQPFFTTKPAGEGTGLGLSLSFDIITKGHGGALKINTEVGKGTEFIIILPE